MSKNKATSEPEKVPVIRAETKFNILLGENTYLVEFGTNSFIRIKECRPELPTAFDVMDEMLPYEAIPFLLDCAISPKNKDWTSYEQFLGLYDECEDVEALAKVLPGYLSAIGVVSKKLQPALAALAALQEKSAK
ncbi:hypothetical protein LZD49_28610 [Dyadobacter sp. CY261]|uniref:hypothetical protein n=1 Tax=Dyadobacter sp. CY261 TaxID=2907203 RepID=UPI001F2AE8B7|nr:hypothetical protein [Dyadobacter sp. CY261]MCF0074481.1 hypothetical protein [Dyadobacter sp. CY261]